MTRRRGYTLIELLVATSLVAGLLFLLSSVFRTTLDGRDRIRRIAVDLSAMRRAHEVISRDFHCATVAPDDSGLQFGLTTGGAATGAVVLQFAANVGEPLLAGRPATETVLLQYTITEDPRTGRSTLFRMETPYPVPEGTTPGAADETRTLPLLPGVVGATFLFYSLEQKTWVESWEGQAGLPGAVRVDLALERDPGPPRAADGARGNRAATAAGEEARQESWIFTLPAAKFASDEALAASSAEAGGDTGGADGAGAAGAGAGATP